MNYTSLAVGAAAGMVVPIVLSIGAAILKETAKVGLKGGFLAYGYGKKTFSDAYHAIESVAAQAREEVHGGSGQPAKKKKSSSSSKSK
jgi:hypothetical protein